MSFDQLNSAVRVKETIERVAMGVVDTVRPASRYATVVSYNTAARTAVVQYPDEAGTFTVKCGGVLPTANGQVVRIAGQVGDRYVDDVIGATVGTMTPTFSTVAANASNTQCILVGPSALGLGSHIYFYNGLGIDPPKFAGDNDQYGTPQARSIGTKIVLWPAADASNSDFAIGIASGTIWQSLPNATFTQFQWYAGKTEIGRLGGAGNFCANSFFFLGSNRQGFMLVGSHWYGATTTATTQSNTTAADVTGCITGSISAQAGDIFIINMIFDFSAATTPAVGECVVINDTTATSTTLSQQALFQGTARSTVAQSVKYDVPSAGSYRIKLTRRVSGGGTYTQNSTHTILRAEHYAKS